MMNEQIIAVFFLAFLLFVVVIAVQVFEQNKSDVKERIASERRAYDEAFKRYLDDPLNNECPEFNPEIWRRVYDWL